MALSPDRQGSAFPPKNNGIFVAPDTSGAVPIPRIDQVRSQTPESLNHDYLLDVLGEHMEEIVRDPDYLSSGAGRARFIEVVRNFAKDGVSMEMINREVIKVYSLDGNHPAQAELFASQFTHEIRKVQEELFDSEGETVVIPENKRLPRKYTINGYLDEKASNDRKAKRSPRRGRS